jgi:hypothetical protein
VLARDVLVHRDASLTPYSGEGIDVPFPVGGTTWTIDVALRAPNGDILVAECRRRADPVKQEDVAAFAYKVELLRQQLGVSVAGVFLTKTSHQLGAVKVGQFEDITMAVLGEGQVPPGFSIVFHRYDEVRAKRRREYVLHVAPGHYEVTFSSEVNLIHRRSGHEDS